MIKTEQNYINRYALFLSSEKNLSNLYTQFESSNEKSLPFFIDIEAGKIFQSKLNESYEQSFLIGTFSEKTKSTITIENFFDTIMFRIKKYFKKYFEFSNQVFVNKNLNEILEMLFNKPGYYYYYPNNMLSEIIADKIFFAQDVNKITFSFKDGDLFKVLLLLNEQARTISTLNYLKEGFKNKILSLFDFLDKEKIVLNYDLCSNFLKNDNNIREDVKNLLFNYLSFLNPDKHLLNKKMDLLLNELDEPTVLGNRQETLSFLGLQQSFSKSDYDNQYKKYEGHRFDKNRNYYLPYQYRYSFFAKEKNNIKNIYILDINNRDSDLRSLINLISTLKYDNCYVSKASVDFYNEKQKATALINDSEEYSTFLDNCTIKNLHVVEFNRDIFKKYIPNCIGNFDYNIF